MKAFLVFLVCVAVSAKVTYHGHKVFEIEVTSENEFHFFQKLVDVIPGSDVWQQPHRSANYTTNGIGQVRIPPTRIEEFEDALKGSHMEYSVVVDDVEELMSRIAPRNDKIYGVHTTKDDFFREYQSYENVMAWVNELVAEHPNIANLTHIGTSFEGRDIVSVEIAGVGGFNPSKPTMFYNGGTHAREWIGSATTFYILNSLLVNYESDPIVRLLIDTMNWVIVPLHNVDGYAYTHNFNTQWRKTRKPNPGFPDCVGTDPNRNWDIAWNEGPTNPCSGTFRGESPFSEPCTQALRNYMASFDNVQGYVDYHCCGNVLLPPWAYQREFPPDEPAHSAMCQRMVEKIAEFSGSVYRHGSNLFSNDSGTIQDYAYGILEILYSMTIELPSAANTNPDLIIGVGDEIFEAVKVMAEIILEEAATA